MKVFCFAFIVYIFMLAVQPCQDFLVPLSDNREGSDEIVQVNTSPVEVSDDCSPFCICSCCSHAVADRCVFRSVAGQTAIATSEPETVNYTDPYRDAFSNSIWQPPKA